MKLIGITGIIASGKSVISDYIKELGYNVIDADEISRQITKKGNTGYFAVVEYFSKDILDNTGNIDRNKLSGIVFSDNKKLEKLNSLLHPIIIDEIYEQISKCKEMAFLDAPLLFETKLDEKCDEIILVYTDTKTQIDRIIKRDKIEKQRAISIINSQLPFSSKILKSNYIIENSGTLDELHGKINNVLSIIKLV